MASAVDQLTSGLVEHELVTEAEVKESLAELTDREDPVALLAALRGHGKLTAWQVEEIQDGRIDRLMMSNYLLLDRLGEGAMGTVYKALHTRMRRVVAVKTIRADKAADSFIERFHREVRVAARLNHPNAIAAYDADESAVGHFLAMEFVEGVDLARILERSGPLPVDEVVEAMRQAAEGMAYAHSQTVVHRDLKPANLMRDINGVIKVADLGLARMDETRAEEEETSKGTVAGTVDYMSPEQAVDTSSVDHRADIYSLGATMFHLLAGRPMFPEATIMKRLLAHRDKPRPSLKDFRDDVPDVIDAIYQRMCAPAPEDRFGTMTEVAEALFDAGGTKRGFKADEAPWNPADVGVLLVEPSKMQGRMIAKQLYELGFGDVELRADGRDALEHFEKMPGDLIVTTMQLPDMTGLELAERLRREMRWSKAAVLILSSTTLPEKTVEVIDRLPAVGLLPKPFDAGQLENSVRDVLKAEKPSFDDFAEKRVLIADDSMLWRKRIESVLRELGFEQFHVANDGAEGARAIDAAGDADGRFDLVVTDYNMPGMNGSEFLQHVRQKSPTPDVPVVMVTTELDPVKIGEVYQLGVSAVCPKTFDPEMVRNVLTRIFL